MHSLWSLRWRNIVFNLSGFYTKTECSYLGSVSTLNWWSQSEFEWIWWWREFFFLFIFCVFVFCKLTKITNWQRFVIERLVATRVRLVKKFKLVRDVISRNLILLESSTGGDNLTLLQEYVLLEIPECQLQLLSSLFKPYVQARQWASSITSNCEMSVGHTPN